MFILSTKLLRRFNCLTQKNCRNINNTAILSTCSQSNHEEFWKFQLRVSEYFDGEYRKIFPLQVIDQKLKRRHYKQFYGLSHATY